MLQVSRQEVSRQRLIKEAEREASRLADVHEMHWLRHPQGSVSGRHASAILRSHATAMLLPNESAAGSGHPCSGSDDDDEDLFSGGGASTPAQAEGASSSTAPITAAPSPAALAIRPPIPVSLRPDDGRSDYCIYDGKCYQLYPNLSMNRNGRKRQPREHERGVCERYIGERIYEARFGAPKGRKRARDGG